jgi:hypothetical protein
MSYPIWNVASYYAVGDVVVEGKTLYECIVEARALLTLPSIDTTHWTFLGSVSGNTFPSGKYACAVGTTQVITIPNLTTSGIVNLTYVHPTGGGAGQFFETVVPTANTLTITLGQSGAITESILWSVAKL